MTTEAKVGAFTLAGLALLAGVVIMLSGFKLGGDKGYTLYAGFSQVIGVEPQSTVRLSGVPVGKVKEIKNDGRGVTVTLSIQSGAKIPKGSQVTIGSSGVMGEKFVNILPADSSQGWAENGDYLIGQDEASMDSLFAGLNTVVGQAQELMAGMNQIFGNPKFQTSVVQLAVNLRDATAHTNGMMAAFEAMAQENKGNVSQMMTNLNMMTASLNRTAGAVEAMMTNLASVGADPQTAENLKITLDNITEASRKIRVISEGVAKVAGDERTIEDTKAVIQNARKLTDRADDLKQKLGRIKVSADTDVLYSGMNHDWSTNFNLNFDLGNEKFMQFGVDDIGGEDKGNAQIGSSFGRFGARAGLIYGEPGIGLDVLAGSRFRVSADTYDLDDPDLRLRTQYRLGAGDTWLMGQWNHVNDSGRRAAYVGIRQSF